jgi:hypothetical protein
MPSQHTPAEFFAKPQIRVLLGFLLLCLLTLVCWFCLARTAQAAPAEKAALWTPLSETQARLAARAPQARPRAFRAFGLNRAALADILSSAPAEFSADAKTRSVELSVPLPDGAWSRFRIVDSPVMESELAARFPQIRTFAGQGIDEPGATARFVWTPKGFHAIILSERGSFYLEPVAAGDTEHYLAYAAADGPRDVSFSCATRGDAPAAHNHAPQRHPNVTISGGVRRYRLAVGVTGEYTQTYGGGTVEGALSAITVIVNSVNAVYERDLGARLVLVNNETSVIFTNPATDGYTSNNIGALVNENRTRLDSILGSGGYDVGHVVDGHHIGGGFAFEGLAYVGVVCNPGFKGGGATILDSVQPADSISAYIVAHEIGHQFGAAHVLNTTAGGCGPSRSASSAFEPASGTTIMGYRWTCGEEDTQSEFIHFHAGSIEQIYNYTLGGGAACATFVGSSNQPPTLDAGPDYHLPANTPFTLRATGGDPDGDTVTYVWDQMDLGSASPPLSDDGARPLFRSSQPTTTPARTFPQMSTILSGAPSITEALPTTTRTLHFRVTARDNHAGSGGVTTDDVTLTSHAGSAFAVTQPGVGAALTGGAVSNVAWDTAGTAGAPFNAPNVRLSLSTDGGQTFPYLLAENTPNDGAENIPLPNVPTGAARIKIEALGNVFFNLSPVFTINAGSGATVQFNLAAGASLSENSNTGLALTVTRAGDAGAPAAVDYATSDGAAEQRTDYVVTTGTINFAAGETLKTVVVPVVNDAYDEPDEDFRLMLTNAVGATLAGAASVTLTIADDDATSNAPNPLETPAFFVRQQYYDFLNRLPDDGGLNYWTGQITLCGADANCLRSQRVNVSAAFFIEQEYQESGAYVYRLYKAAFGEQAGYRPSYVQFTPDRARVVGGAELASSKLAFAQAFANRAEFLSRYPSSQSAAQFVDAILATVQQGAGVSFTAAQRDSFINDVNSGGRGQMLRNLADDATFKQAVFNRAFVLTQYFGYLRRDPDQGGYDFWLNALNQQPQNARGMVCAFLTAAEYQTRFGANVPRSNAECN